MVSTAGAKAAAFGHMYVAPALAKLNSWQDMMRFGAEPWAKHVRNLPCPKGPKCIQTFMLCRDTDGHKVCITFHFASNLAYAFVSASLLMSIGEIGEYLGLDSAVTSESLYELFCEAGQAEHDVGDLQSRLSGGEGYDEDVGDRVRYAASLGRGPKEVNSASGKAVKLEDGSGLEDVLCDIPRMLPDFLLAAKREGMSDEEYEELVQKERFKTYCRKLSKNRKKWKGTEEYDLMVRPDCRDCPVPMEAKDFVPYL